MKKIVFYIFLVSTLTINLFGECVLSYGVLTCMDTAIRNQSEVPATTNSIFVQNSANNIRGVYIATDSIDLKNIAETNISTYGSGGAGVLAIRNSSISFSNIQILKRKEIAVMEYGLIEIHTLV